MKKEKRKSDRAGSLLLCSIWLTVTPAFCQVTNNQIRNRVELKLDSGWFTSTTAQASVEWDCVNNALTNKCLIYHNDQWFTIKAEVTGPLFLNVAHQTCKKLYGVQLVVIEGDPCQTSTYRLKECIPFTNQSDFFIRLDSMVAGEEYLINVDGYLGDFCSFEIAFSSSFQGLPVTGSLFNINSTISLKDSVVTINWTIPDSLSKDLKKFQLFRKRASEKSGGVISHPMNRNAYGAAQTTYQFMDTLREKDEYVYSIFGVTEDNVLLLSRQELSYRGNSKPPRIRENFKRHIDYFVKRDRVVAIHVLDAFTEKRLFSANRRSVKGKNTVILDFKPFADEGITNFTVIIDSKDEKQSYPVRIALK